MTITRVIDGKTMEFELLPHERLQAYIEQEHLYDIDDVRQALHVDWPDKFRLAASEYGLRPENITPDVIDDIASEFREIVNKYDFPADDAIQEAIGRILAR